MLCWGGGHRAAHACGGHTGFGKPDREDDMEELRGER